MVRRPVVAGQFYSSSRGSLEQEVGRLLSQSARKADAIGAVSPHAGYIYSGRIASKVFGAIAPKSTYVIIGPNHTGRGAQFSLDTSESWQTPLGNASLDLDLAKGILEHSEFIQEDREAHAFEHAIEVQLPFLQISTGQFKFVPLIVAYADIDTYKAIGREIAHAIQSSQLQGKVTIIASSDMTHYEPHARAKEKDSIAISAILKLDEEALDRAVREFDISMCGYAPTCIMLAAAKGLGAQSARLIEYATSGDTSGDYSSVVGYAGLVVT